MLARYSASSTAVLPPPTTHDVLVAVEEAVARRAARHALAHEGALARQPQVLGRGAGGDDQRVAGVGAAVAGQPERALRQFDGVDVVEHDLGIEALRMAQEALHQVRALHAVGICRPVVHVRRGHQLAALRQAGDQHRVSGSPGRRRRRRCIRPGRNRGSGHGRAWSSTCLAFDGKREAIIGRGSPAGSQGGGRQPGPAGNGTAGRGRLSRNAFRA